MEDAGCKTRDLDEELDAFFQELAGVAPSVPAPPADFTPSESIVVCKDAVLLRGLRPATQQALCDELETSRFFAANNEKTRHVDMMHLGKHEAHGRLRVVAPVPSLFVDLAAAAQRLAAERHGHLRSIPTLRCDVAVVNAYRAGSRLGLHVDKRSLRHPGLPVVAISLGDEAEFVFKRSWKASAPSHRVILRSGDVLVFGGSARGMVHGMERVHVGTAPTGPDAKPALRLGAQPWRRVCITLREH